MKLSNTLLSNSPVYSLLAIYMPLAVLTALTFLLKGLIPLSPAPLLISGGLTALIASFFCDFMKDAKTGRTTADIRGGLVVMVIAYGLSSLFRWDVPWEKRFLPSLSAILASIGTLYVWVSVLSLKQFFVLRGRLESYMAAYHDKQLYKMLFDDWELLQDTDRAISKTKRSYLVQLLLIGIILLINTASKIHVPPVLYIFLVGIVASGICIFGLLGIMRREHYSAAEGLTSAASIRTKHMLSIGIVAAISIVAAVVLSSNNSVLPFSVITGFFDGILKVISWILGLFVLLWALFMKLFSRKSEVAVEPEPAEMEPLAPFLEQVEKSDPSPFWTWFKYGLIALVAAAFIWFIVLPLFSRGRAFSGKMTFRQKVGRIITEWFEGMRNGLASFFVFIKSGGTAHKLRKPSAEEIQRAAGDILGAYSPAKKREMKQSVTLFAKLIIWGGEVCQVAWKPIHAPGEYCSLLAASVEAPSGSPPENALPEAPLLGEKIIRCGELFEKALYSAEVLSEAERKEFKDGVEEITSFADNQRKESL